MTNNETSAPDPALVGNEGVSLDFSTLPTVVTNTDNGPDTVEQINNRDISSGDGTGVKGAVTLNAGDVFDLASLGSTLFITGDDSQDGGQDFLVLGDAWNSGGTVTEGGVTFHSYMATIAGQTVTLNVEQGLGIAVNPQDG